jgi:hypothetical protein
MRSGIRRSGHEPAQQAGHTTLRDAEPSTDRLMGDGTDPVHYLRGVMLIGTREAARRLGISPSMMARYAATWVKQRDAHYAAVESGLPTPLLPSLPPPEAPHVYMTGTANHPTYLFLPEQIDSFQRWRNVKRMIRDLSGATDALNIIGELYDADPENTSEQVRSAARAVVGARRARRSAGR